MKKKPYKLSKEPYHVRRLCGQFAKSPSDWWIILGKADIHPANELYDRGLAECRNLPGGMTAYRATDEGRAAWAAFVKPEAAK